MSTSGNDSVSKGPEKGTTQERADLRPERTDDVGMTATDGNRLRAVLGKLSHLNLTGDVELWKEVAGGGYCDVFIGFVLCRQTRTKVAVRRLRSFIINQHDFRKMLARELEIWSTLNHPNILPLFGYSVDDNEHSLSFISEWMDNGRADKYVQDNPNCDIAVLILGIARGLAYLHEKGIAHCDMKAENVLISASCQPLICDFGISRAVMSSNTVSESPAGSIRWMARELLVADLENPDIIPQHSSKTDVWSFGMTVYELLTGQIPYAETPHSSIMLYVMWGKLPTLPKALSNMSILQKGIWELCLSCWKMNSSERPDMDAIVFDLSRLPSCETSSQNQYAITMFERQAMGPLVSVLQQLSYLDLTAEIRDLSHHPVATGGYCDVFIGFLHRDQMPGKVAVRRFRSVNFKQRDFNEMLAQELEIWPSLEHPNVLPLLGFCAGDSGRSLSLVTEWMDNGSAKMHVQNSPNCDIMLLVLGIAEGVAYLHRNDIIHGCIRATNILISASFQPLIYNFNISRAMMSSTTLLRDNADSLRWMAQELFVSHSENPDMNLQYSQKTDVWSFGMTIYELLSGNVPYHNKSLVYFLSDIMRGGLLIPPEPPSPGWPRLHYSLWEIAEDCWSSRPELRPSMEDIVECLKDIRKPDFIQMSEGVKIHPYLRSDKYGFVPLMWNIQLPPSSASLYMDRERNERRPIQMTELHSPSTTPASTNMKVFVPFRNLGPIEISSSTGFITMENVLQAIYDHYQQRLNIHTIPPRKRVQINLAFRMRCEASRELGGPNLEDKVKERGVCQVDRLGDEVHFESLMIISVEEENTWELHLSSPHS